MVGYTRATEPQKNAVKDMISKMMSPKRGDPSFTMGWDVVASFSESQINKLLAARHEKEGNGLLQEVAFDAEDIDPRTEEVYVTHYHIKFGPPLLQFDEKATSMPMCSIEMKVRSGTSHWDDGRAPKEMGGGWAVKLNNIPLATAKGKLSDEGTIEGTPVLIDGTQAVHFDYGQTQATHVVLGFDMDRSKLTVEVKAPEGFNKDSRKNALMKASFKHAFTSFFVGGTELDADGTAAKRRSLSYSLASINNKTNDEAAELTPVKFQFATIGGTDNRLLSMFIQVRGGSGSGISHSLQERWASQWLDNETFPVPRDFSASLIISSRVFKDVILKSGFEKSNWTITDVTPEGRSATELDCRSRERWHVPEQNHAYTNTNVFHVDGFDIDLSDKPMRLTIQQDDPGAVPNVYSYWEINQRVHWESTYKLFGFGGRVTGDQGWINAKYRLCDPQDFSKPRKLGAKCEASDSGLILDFNLAPGDFRMDQPEGNGIDYGTWRKGMEGLWTKAPSVRISAFGIGFLRTTNLLMPGQQVIDINEEIGLRIPKDLVLVGHVEKEVVAQE